MRQKSTVENLKRKITDYRFARAGAELGCGFTRFAARRHGPDDK